MSFLNELFKVGKRYQCSVFIYAYMALNVGDDLFIHKLVSTYPHIRFVICSKRPYKQIFSEYSNVIVWEEDSLVFSMCKKLRIADKVRWKIIHRCDYAVYIGGSIFREYSEWNEQHLWYKNLFDNDKLYFMSCNWGPYKTKQFKENMTTVLSKMKDVCFRDQISYSSFSHLPNVRYAPDVLFGLDWSEYVGIEEKKQVFVSASICRAEGEPLEEYVTTYCQYIKQWTEHFVALGYQVKLCSFCEKLGDTIVAEKIMNSLEEQFKQHTSIVNYCGTNLNEILKLLAESEYVLATRFHALILGLVARKKVLPIIYSSKMRNILSDISFQGLCFDIMQPPQDYSIREEEITYGITDYEREALSKKSGKHFDMLNKVLK